MSGSVIKYESKNGYMGLLYGESSLSVFNSDGEEVFHTGFRTIDTLEELVATIERFPDFNELFIKLYEKIENNDNEEV